MTVILKFLSNGVNRGGYFFLEIRYNLFKKGYIKVNELQLKAFNMYLESATEDNNFTTISFAKLADKLISEGEKCSSSAIGRWAKKWNWAKHVSKKRTETSTINITEEKNVLQFNKNVLQSNNVLRLNEELGLSLYKLLYAQIQKYENKLKRSEFLTMMEEKNVLNMFKAVTAREDKLLDRETLLKTSVVPLITSEEVLKALSEETIEMEED